MDSIIQKIVQQLTIQSMIRSLAENKTPHDAQSE